MKSFKVGDKVRLDGCPFDEQIAQELIRYIEVKDRIQTVTKVGFPGDLDAPWDDNPQLGRQWVKTDLMTDWTEAGWFELAVS